MSLRNEYTVFSDIPGFGASKGERIINALQRLWTKIEHLEKNRLLEKKSKSKEVQTGCNNEDYTVCDVQYQLLVLQLRYARSILKSKAPPFSVTSCHEQEVNCPDGDVNVTLKDMKAIVTSQETQTGNSLIFLSNTDEEEGTNSRVDAQVNTDVQLFPSEDPLVSSSLVSKDLPSSSKFTTQSHYHLKLDHVPFLLGASSSASHSVVANVQNIIAMMKTHNKALCGPKLHPSRPATSASSSKDSQDATKLMHKLSQDLHELTLKHHKIAAMLDNVQGKDQINVNKNETNIDELNVIGQPRDSSTKLQAQTKKAIKAKDATNTCKRLQRAFVQCNNPPTIARRTLLRSLQNFKTHLSEEDISWD